MKIQLDARPDCPALETLRLNVDAALKGLGTSADLLIQESSDAVSCPRLLVDAVAVCSCFPGKDAPACTVCGETPDIPDAEIIRWHLARALGRKTVLFMCSGNAVRSQMAEAIVNQSLGDTWAAFSGGIIPMQLWKPVIQVLKEIDIDADGRKAKHIEIFLGCRFDLIISLCSDADGFCTAFPGEGVREHMPFDDPMTSSFFGVGDISRARRLRDDMRKKLISGMERHR
jgi:arsenate reductase